MWLFCCLLTEIHCSMKLNFYATSQVAVNVKVNKSKSNKALENFVKASLGVLLSFGVADLTCTADLSVNTLMTQSHELRLL